MKFCLQVRPAGVGPDWWPRELVPVEGSRSLRQVRYHWVYAHPKQASWSLAAPSLDHLIDHDRLAKAVDTWYDEHGEDWPWEFRVLTSENDLAGQRRRSRTTTTRLKPRRNGR